MNKAFQCVATVFAVSAMACIHTSPPPEQDQNVLSPLGVFSEIVGGDIRYEGELLMLTGTSFLLLTRDRVVVIPFVLARVGYFKAIDVGTYGAPSPANSEQLRLASRYPSGIPEAAMAAILRSKGQTAPDTAKTSR